MNDKPASPDAAWASVLRDRRDDLLRDRDLIEARLAEVNELLKLIETPAAEVKARRVRQPRVATVEPLLAPVTDAEGGVV